MKMKNIATAAVFLFLTAIGCTRVVDDEAGTVPTTKTAFNPQQQKLADIKTGKLENRLVSSVIACTGDIEVPPQGMASVSPTLGGYLVATDMIPGTFVKKGSVLATLSNPEYISLQQSYLETSGQLKYAEQEYSRQKLLIEQDATAVKKLQESESLFTVLKARLAGLKEQLKMIGIYLPELEKGDIQPVVYLKAPINGYVTAVNHHPGQFVEAREVIFEIVNMNDLHLHLNVFEQDIGKVNKGQVIRFRPTGSDARYLGEVFLVSPKRDDAIRSFGVHGHIHTGERSLKPGMYVEAEILVTADSVPALPESAFVYSNNKPFVVIEEGGSYSLREVETGEKLNGWVAIVNHEALVDKTIVTEGASRIYSAMRRASK